MKAILITDKPKWCRLMMNGDKIVETRKGDKLYKATQKLIDEYGCAVFYVCCKKTSPWLDWSKGVAKLNNGKGCIETSKSLSHFNGKVAFKFKCYKVDKFTLGMLEGDLYFSTKDGWMDFPNEEAQLDNFELLDYTGVKIGTKLSAIHISDLEIFEQPKKISEFQGFCNSCAAFRVCKLNRESCDKSIKKAPQSFCYVEIGDYDNGSK